MLNELEKKILKFLNKNARTSYLHMAQEAGVSTTAINSAMKKLENSEVIKGYVPIIDLESIGFGLVVLIALRVNQGGDLPLQKRLNKYDEVRSVYKITGEWDYILVCIFKDLKELEDFLINQLSLPQVERVITHIVLNTVKDEKRTLVLNS